MTTWNVNWLNQNTQRKYPLSELATGVSADGSFVLPDSVLADMTLSVPVDAGYDPTAFYLGAVTAYGQIATFTFKYGTTTVGSVAVDTTAHTLYSIYTASGVGEFAACAIRCCVADVEVLKTFGGSTTYTVEAGRLEATVIRPGLQGVTSITATVGSTESAPMRGPIELVEGSNIRLTPIAPVEPGEKARIRIDARLGAVETDCGDGSSGLGQAVRSVGGAIPNAQGAISIVTLGGCLSATGAGNTLTLTDNCASSCCGDDEMAVVADAVTAQFEALRRMETSAALLEQKILALETSLGMYLTVPEVTGD